MPAATPNRSDSPPCVTPASNDVRPVCTRVQRWPPRHLHRCDEGAPASSVPRESSSCTNHIGRGFAVECRELHRRGVDLACRASSVLPRLSVVERRQLPADRQEITRRTRPKSIGRRSKRCAVRRRRKRLVRYRRIQQRHEERIRCRVGPRPQDRVSRGGKGGAHESPSRMKHRVAGHTPIRTRPRRNDDRRSADGGRAVSEEQSMPSGRIDRDDLAGTGRERHVSRDTERAERCGR